MKIEGTSGPHRQLCLLKSRHVPRVLQNTCLAVSTCPVLHSFWMKNLHSEPPKIVCGRHLPFQNTVARPIDLANGLPTRSFNPTPVEVGLIRPWCRPMLIICSLGTAPAVAKEILTACLLRTAVIIINTTRHHRLQELPPAPAVIIMLENATVETTMLRLIIPPEVAAIRQVSEMMSITLLIHRTATVTGLIILLHLCLRRAAVGMGVVDPIRVGLKTKELK
mmetsp:Transcript_15103/g.31117  ORF Transcript_15103/g.31117 Transcript_15103/m.31117 type:complete len:222 (+) Transcript_15103:915-1580(+)